MNRAMRSASACLVGVALVVLSGCAEDRHTSSAIVAQGVSVHHSATFWESEPSPSPEPTVTDASGVTTPSHTPPPSDTAAENDSPSLPKAMTAAERQFAWAESPELFNGYTVVLVRGETPEQVLQILAAHHVGPIRSGAQTVLAAQAAEGDITSNEPYYTTILAGNLPNGWTVAIEDDGYQATVDGRAARLSAGGTEVAVFWNINLDAQFDYARSGVLLRSFDPIA